MAAAIPPATPLVKTVKKQRATITLSNFDLQSPSPRPNIDNAFCICKFVAFVGIDFLLYDKIILQEVFMKDRRFYYYN